MGSVTPPSARSIPGPQGLLHPALKQSALTYAHAHTRACTHIHTYTHCKKGRLGPKESACGPSMGGRVHSCPCSSPAKQVWLVRFALLCRGARTHFDALAHARDAGRPAGVSVCVRRGGPPSHAHVCPHRRRAQAFAEVRRLEECESAKMKDLALSKARELQSACIATRIPVPRSGPWPCSC